MAGARGKYEEIKKYIPQIMQWRRQDGLTEKDVAARLGIHHSTLIQYKEKHPEFKEAMDLAKQAIISETFAALLKRAKGYEYEEKKVWTRQEETESGPKEVTYTEITKKHEPPNVAACSLLLKNLDREHDWSDNPTMLAVKRQELELKKTIAENSEW